MLCRIRSAALCLPLLACLFTTALTAAQPAPESAAPVEPSSPLPQAAEPPAAAVPDAPLPAGPATSETEPLAPLPATPAPAPPSQRAPTRPLRDSCVDCAAGYAQRVGSSPVRYTLESIQIRGNTRTSNRVVLRYIPFQAGDVLDVDNPQIELTRFRLLGTGFFRDVQFSLKKGSQRGLVALVIDVRERNTIVVNDIFMGLSADADTNGSVRNPLTAYAGLDIAETNLGGTGITLGTAAAFAESQLALRVRFLDPAFLGSPWMVNGILLFNDSQDYFGNALVRTADPANLANLGRYAIVRYKRFGGTFGVGRDLSVATQLWLNYRLESIDASYPLQASHLRGFTREPIDFDVVRGRSVLSTLRATLQHDTRDHPFLPSRGWFVAVRGEVSLLPAALDYDYQRLELDASRWWRLPWRNHVLRLGFFAGAIAGNAPFFEQFHVGDFSDFLPDRVLGVNFDRRPPPNFLGTQIAEVRYGHYALRLGTEYRVPLYRGKRSVFGIDAFASAGLYAVASRRDLTDPADAYSGVARVPVDLTGNLGFRIDTSAGGFGFAFSNVLSFIPVRGEGPAGGQ